MTEGRLPIDAPRARVPASPEDDHGLGISTLGVTLSYQRVAQLADLRVAIAPEKGTWGVWCQHEKRWVQVVGLGRGAEREAWQLLIGTSSSHPWELRIAQADDEGQPILREQKKSKAEPCHVCSGSGNCANCHGSGDCEHCDGRGKEPAG